MNMSGYKKKARNIGRGTFLAMALFFFMLPTLATAGDVKDYVPLAPLPGTYCPPGTTDPTCANTTSGGTTLGRYLPGLFKLGIGIAGVLAVIMIMIGGVEYMMSESITSKGAGKDKMRDAIIGLLLAMGAWIILNTINPNLVDTETSPAPLTAIPVAYRIFSISQGLAYSFQSNTWVYSYRDANSPTGVKVVNAGPEKTCIEASEYDSTKAGKIIVDACHKILIGTPSNSQDFAINLPEACEESRVTKAKDVSLTVSSSCFPVDTKKPVDSTTYPTKAACEAKVTAPNVCLPA